MMVLFLATGLTFTDSQAHSGIVYHLGAPDDGFWAEMIDAMSPNVRSLSDEEYGNQPEGLRISRGRLSNYQR